MSESHSVDVFSLLFCSLIQISNINEAVKLLDSSSSATIIQLNCAAS